MGWFYLRYTSLYCIFRSDVNLNVEPGLAPLLASNRRDNSGSSSDVTTSDYHPYANLQGLLACADWTEEASSEILSAIKRVQDQAHDSDVVPSYS